MSPHTQHARDHRFLIGLAAGTLIGAGVALWLVPRSAAELRERVTDSAKRLRRVAANEYQRARAGVDAAAGTLSSMGRGVRDDIAGAVARGAHEVERQAEAVRTPDAAVAKAGRASTSKG